MVGSAALPLNDIGEFYRLRPSDCPTTLSLPIQPRVPIHSTYKREGVSSGRLTHPTSLWDSLDLVLLPATLHLMPPPAMVNPPPPTPRSDAITASGPRSHL